MKLINAITEQECEFDTPEAASEFLANIPDAADWIDADAPKVEAKQVATDSKTEGKA